VFHRKPISAVALALGVALLFAGLPGCGSGIPKTYPVKGRVVWKGGKPVTYGRIEFQSVSQPTLTAVGRIESDGAFSLTTHKDGKTRPGAVAGQHRVLVEPAVGDSVGFLPDPYTVEPRENDLTIEITPRRR